MRRLTIFKSKTALSASILALCLAVGYCGEPVVPEKLNFVSSDVVLDGGSIVFLFKADEESYRLIVSPRKENLPAVPVPPEFAIKQDKNVIVLATASADSTEKAVVEKDGKLERRLADAIQNGAKDFPEDGKPAKIVRLVLECLKDRDIDLYSKDPLLLRSQNVE